MTTDVKKKGILNPWRIVAPVKPTPVITRPNGKINLDQIDYDEDLRPNRSGVLRGTHTSIEVANKNIESDNDVLRDLVACLLDLQKIPGITALFTEQKIGAQQGPREFGVISTDSNFATLSTTIDYKPVTHILFKNQTLDQGLFYLVRILRRVQGRPEGEKILKRWGVVPMLR